MSVTFPTDAGARIVTVSGKRCRMDLCGGGRVDAVIRGRLLDEDSAVAVGDFVEVQHQSDTWTVERVLPRANEFVRAGLRNERQVLFANVDRALIVASLSEPETKTATIDRFVVAALRGGIEPWLVLTKSDLDDHGRAAEVRAVYDAFQLPVFEICNLTGENVDALAAAIAGGVSGLVGNSGVGKSALLNRLIPGLDLRVGEISAWSGKGRHTTTAALLVAYGERGFLIDTAGMKSFVPYGISRETLVDLFPEIGIYAPGCRFRNCRHLSEPDCAVRAAVDSGELSAARLRSYYRLLEGLTA